MAQKAKKSAPVEPPLPEGYQSKNGIAWGSRLPGLLEIAYFNWAAKNAVRGET